MQTILRPSRQNCSTHRKNMAPAVVDCVTGSLIAVGPHLPLIGIAAGALGALVAAYVKAKEDDEAIKTFVIWCGGVKDWLILVAGRVDKSGGENTVAVFEELKTSLLGAQGCARYAKQARVS